MNDTTDYPALFRTNVLQLSTYLQDAWPISDDRLFARKNYEELLKNLNRRAQAAGCAADMIEPEFPELLKLFVQQNVEAETYSRKAERVKEYERGRTDMQAAIQFGAVPDSFQRKPPVDRQSFPELVASPPSPSAPPPFMPPITEKPIMLTPAMATPRFSEAEAEYYKENEKLGRSADGRQDVRLIVQFLIDRFGDIHVKSFTKEHVELLDSMLPHIPDRNNIPREFCASLATRYDYAQQHGWDNLKRLTEARLRKGYHSSLSKFFGWLITKGYYKDDKPIFNEVDGKNLVSLPRDSFDYEEVKEIFSQPLFQGCKTPSSIWKSGTYFVQSHIYWGYILLFLHGLRLGEIGQLDVGDIVEHNGVFYIDLRAFDPRGGRVAIEDLKKFKTAGSQRLVPLHPLVIELGLLDRAKELKERGCTALFPEWEPYPKPNGEMRWGQPLTKSWQYLKKKIGINRADVTAYSTRHWFADFLDSTGISHKGRMMVMGHSTRNDIPAGYGSKKRLSTRDLNEIATTPSPEIQFMTESLLRAKATADAGHLVVVKPWLQRSNWSDYYRTKFGPI